MRKRIRRFAGGALLTAVSLLVTFLVAEVGLRLAGVSYPRWKQTDPDLGFVHQPGVSGWWRDEGEAFVQISSAGLRDREHAVRKEPGTLRIAVLGDSYAEALQLPWEQAFWAEMERQLRQCPAVGERPVEAINFGVSSYGTTQQLIQLRRDVWRYDPDVVVLAFLTGNDVVNNSRELETGLPYRPFFVKDGDTLALDNSFRDSGWFRSRSNPLMTFALDHSRVFQLVNRARSRMAERAAAGAVAAAPQGGEVGLVDDVYRPPRDSAWASAWDVTETVLETMAREVQARGKGFLVATLSNGIQVNPDSSLRGRALRAMDVPDLFYPDRRVAEAGARAGFRVLTLAPMLRDTAARTGEFLHGFDGSGDGHWNARGHAVAGRLIARELCASGMVAPPAPDARTGGGE